MHDEQRDMTRAAVSCYSEAEVKSFCSRFQSQSKWSSQKQPWIEQFWCWLSFVECVSCSCVGEWWSTHLYVSCLVCFLIANARVDWKRNISLSFHSYWEREKMLNYLTDCTGDQYAPNKIMKPNEKRRNKTKPYCIISEGRLNAESDFKSICAVYREREREWVHLFTEILGCCCVDPCTSCSMRADKASAECVLIYSPPKRSSFGNSFVTLFLSGFLRYWRE